MLHCCLEQIANVVLTVDVDELKEWIGIRLMTAQLLAAHWALLNRLLLFPPIFDARLAEGMATAGQNNFFLGVQADTALGIEFLVVARHLTYPGNLAHFILVLIIV